jgi:hypothetical protein
MQNVGLGAGIFLIAVGAILTWAVRNPANSAVNVHVVGVILMLVGLASALLSLLFWQSWAGWGYWARRGHPGWQRRRTTYVEEAPPPPPELPRW